jgi:hypothetical protein
VRCLRSDGLHCGFCAEEYGRRARYVFPVRVDGAVRLVELGRVQYQTLALVYQEGRWLGTRLRLAREWDAANARIQVTFLGREGLTDEVVVDIEEYVSTLGVSAAQRFQPVKATLPSQRSDGSNS